MSKPGMACILIRHTLLCQVWLEGEDRAELQAIARTAKHRLQRGIWTSPGAGQHRMPHFSGNVRTSGGPSGWLTLLDILYSHMQRHNSP